MSEFAWIDLGDGRSVFRRIDERTGPRSSLPCPMVMTDTMPETQSMLDGKFYTSKSQLRQTYKQAGVIEVGNDAARFRVEKPKPDRKTIREAVRKAASEYKMGRRPDKTPVQP